MTKADNKKTFIPRDKPKSYIIAITAGLFGLLIAGPLMFVEHFFGLGFLSNIGKVLFVTSWAVGTVMGIIFTYGFTTGRYQDMEERDWDCQRW